MAKTHYNLIAGQNLDRLSALSDGIFAVAMTLLVLDLHVPGVGSGVPVITSDHQLGLALLGLWPRLLTYLMSFLTLGIYWVAQQTQLNFFTRCDRDLTWIHLGFLLAVTVIPFSTGVLAEHTRLRIALFVYWLNIFILGLMLFWSIRYAKREGLLKAGSTDGPRTPHEYRIFAAQSLYSIGLLISLFNTYWSLVFLVLVQLNYAIAPRVAFIEWLSQWASGWANRLLEDAVLRGIRRR